MGVRRVSKKDDEQIEAVTRPIARERATRRST